MKSLAWIEAENREIEQRIAKKHADSISRLKKRIRRVLWRAPAVRSDAMAAIDAWADAERKRGG